ncbi:hypothetical protein IV203_036952 [Nitzschia inconspicua]|uniref:Uncharacterized protein n=1 Tax=Nitzschia inconspicua TaxID=303405 RepID=A0A9K3LJ64_9STRA|nr:hypothetical protein IV203_036952 [Nitzschia inconspicua]
MHSWTNPMAGMDLIQSEQPKNSILKVRRLQDSIDSKYPGGSDCKKTRETFTALSKIPAVQHDDKTSLPPEDCVTITPESNDRSHGCQRHGASKKALGVDVEDFFVTDHSFDCPPVRDHLLVRRVKQAFEKTGACETMFNNFIGNAQARMAFFKRNLPALPIEKFSLYGGGENAKKALCGGATGTGILMDPRCFVTHFNALSSVTQNIHMNLQHQQHAINDIRSTTLHEM